MEEQAVRLTREELHRLVWTKPLRSLAEEWGISDVGLGKICKRHNIPRPGLGFWAKVEHGKPVERVPLPAMVQSKEIVIQRHFFSPQEYPQSPIDEEQMRLADELRAADRLPESKIVVSPRLTNPHPLVALTRRCLSEAETRWGVVRTEDKGTLAVEVSPSGLARAMRLMDTLFKALEKRGMRIEITPPRPRRWSSGEDPARTVVHVLGEAFAIEIREDVYLRERPVTAEQKKSREKYSWYTPRPKYDAIPSGHFTLRIVEPQVWGIRRVWRDTGRQKLENLLNSVVMGLIDAALTQRCENLRRAEQERQRLEKLRQEQEREEQRQEELRRRNRLAEEVQAWEFSQSALRFVEEMRRRAESVGEGIQEGSAIDLWLKWAQAVSARENPLNAPLPDLATYGSSDGRAAPSLGLAAWAKAASHALERHERQHPRW